MSVRSLQQAGLTMTFAEAVTTFGEDRLYPEEIPDDLRATIYDWFQYRLIGSITGFPLFFRRQLAHDYRRYTELLRIEPGVSRYDWLVEEYLELQRHALTHDTRTKTGSKGITRTDSTSMTASDEASASETTTHGGTLTSVRTPDLTSTRTHDLTDTTTHDTTDTASGTQSDTGSLSRDVRNAVSGDDRTTTVHGLQIAHTGTDSTSSKTTEEVTRGTTETLTFDTDTATTGTDTHAKTGSEETTRDTLDTHTPNLIETSTHGKTLRTTDSGSDSTETKRTGTDRVQGETTSQSDRVELTKVAPMSVGYAALTPTAPTAGGSAGSTVPALDWQTASTQGEGVTTESATSDSTTTHNTTDVTEQSFGKSVYEQAGGSDSVTRTGSEETAGTGTIDVARSESDTRTAALHDAKTGTETTAVTGGDSTEGTRSDTRTVAVTDTHSGTDTATVTHGRVDTATQTDASTTSRETTSTATKTGTETVDTEGTITDAVSGTERTVDSDARTIGVTQSSGAERSVEASGESETTESVSETAGGDGSTLERMVRTGRHGTIAGMLRQAQDFILGSDAWVWLKMQLEPCFLAVYDPARYIDEREDWS